MQFLEPPAFPWAGGFIVCRRRDYRSAPRRCYRCP